MRLLRALALSLMLAGLALAAPSVTIPPSGGGADTDDQTAAEVTVTPTGSIAATDVQGALAEIGSDEGGATLPLFDVAAASDNQLFFAAPFALTITGFACHYIGSLPTDQADFTLSDGAGNALTITGSSPTCAASTANATYATVTAANVLAKGELLLVHTGNTPDPTGSQDYVVHITFTRN